MTKCREFRTPFPPRDIRKNPRSMYARVPQAMAQFVLIIELLSHIMGTTPIIKMARAYGLRPQLWLLIVINGFSFNRGTLTLPSGTIHPRNPGAIHPRNPGAIYPVLQTSDDVWGHRWQCWPTRNQLRECCCWTSTERPKMNADSFPGHAKRFQL